MCDEGTAEHTFSMIRSLLIRTHHIFLGRICNMLMSMWTHVYYKRAAMLRRMVVVVMLRKKAVTQRNAPKMEAKGQGSPEMLPDESDENKSSEMKAERVDEEG